MKSLALVSVAVFALCGFANAQEEQDVPESGISTRTFASHTLHEIPTMNLKAEAGLGTGFAIFSALFIFALIRILIDEIQRHKEMTQKLIDSRNKMNELGMNIENIDQQYLDMKNKKAGDEDTDAKLIEKAAQKKKAASAEAQQLDQFEIGNDNGERL